MVKRGEEEQRGAEQLDTTHEEACSQRERPCAAMEEVSVTAVA
jgi:hypothetical protein